MSVEGVVFSNTAGGVLFKKTLEKDGCSKTLLSEQSFR